MQHLEHTDCNFVGIFKLCKFYLCFSSNGLRENDTNFCFSYVHVLNVYVSVSHAIFQNYES